MNIVFNWTPDASKTSPKETNGEITMLVSVAPEASIHITNTGEGFYGLSKDHSPDDCTNP
ncbi:hypothetical protein GCM10007866_21080 [Gluconobacter albidus]|uniref:Uncharacterized protein n=1 Tax=Gluconobacter albidus TaxID=318683 RepID=A0AAW3R128_9PROT|nr:hypothetical protein AD941_02815 [Gluconobacter albidus]GLQ69655.1 hypothetical protein GCM10007866_21080 [Gluconobacter albidus]